MVRRILLPTFIVALAACGGELATPKQAPLPPIVVSSEEGDQKAFGRQMRALLLAGQFDSLAAIAQDLRTTRVRFPSGSWKLRGYYLYGFGRPDDESDIAQWEQLITHLRSWIEIRPQSITPRVALAYALDGYAWHARGTDWSHKVTVEGRRLMVQREAEARQVLLDARNLQELCPGWWAVALQVANAEDWDEEIYEKVFQEAVAFDPEYWGYFAAKAAHLLPKWGGEPGDWERFATEVADRLPEPEGSALYARIVSSLREDYEGDNRTNIFNQSSASWVRTQRGFRRLREDYPNSLSLLSEFAILAGQAGDRPLAKQLMGEIGNRVDLGVWGNRVYFHEFRQWADSL